MRFGSTCGRLRSRSTRPAHRDHVPARRSAAVARQRLARGSSPATGAPRASWTGQSRRSCRPHASRAAQDRAAGRRNRSRPSPERAGRSRPGDACVALCSAAGEVGRHPAAGRRVRDVVDRDRVGLFTRPSCEGERSRSVVCEWARSSAPRPRDVPTRVLRHQPPPRRRAPSPRARYRSRSTS